jgi:site-specific DNA recombinase
MIDADGVAAASDAMPLDHRRAVIGELMTIRLRAVGRGTRTFRPETVETEWKIDS